jgi:HEAT repeat protein
MSQPNLRLTALLIGVLSLCLISASSAQNPATPAPNHKSTDQKAAGQKAATPDDTDIVPADRLHRTIAENTSEAWDTITTALNDPKHSDVRIQALAALGTLVNNPRGEELITAAMKDPDFDVRTASILAAGQTKDRNLTTPIRKMLTGSLHCRHHALEDERPFRRRHPRRSSEW